MNIVLSRFASKNVLIFIDDILSESTGDEGCLGSILGDEGESGINSGG